MPYSAEFSQPSRWPASWSAIATTPENSGVAALVPPKMWYGEVGLTNV